MEWKPYIDALILVVLVFVSISYGYRIGRKSVNGEALVELPKKKQSIPTNYEDLLEESYVKEGDL